jgi:hypothetical protein
MICCDFELNGNEARLVNTTLASTLLISGSNHVTVRDLIIDYDPLPFTQGDDCELRPCYKIKQPLLFKQLSA